MISVSKDVNLMVNLQRRLHIHFSRCRRRRRPYTVFTGLLNLMFSPCSYVQRPIVRRVAYAYRLIGTSRRMLPDF